MGQSDIGTAGQFYKALLGGNRQQIMQQASPAVSAAREAADAAKREQAARGTARTGGTAAQNQQIEDEVRRQIDSIIGQQQSQAAAGLKGVSDTELSTMMNALGIGTSAAQSDINSRRAASAQMWSSLIGGAGALVGGGLAGGAFKGLLGGLAKANPNPGLSPDSAAGMGGEPVSGSPNFDVSLPAGGGSFWNPAQSSMYNLFNPRYNY